MDSGAAFYLWWCIWIRGLLFTYGGVYGGAEEQGAPQRPGPAVRGVEPVLRVHTDPAPHRAHQSLLIPL